MSVVAPNGQVRLLKDVPIDSTYENTLYFDTKTQQTEYFLALTPVHVMSNATRVREGVIAVDVEADNVLKCNYLMFQNENFSSKWFYGFVDYVEYVNNSLTYIHYSIDEVQTWLFEDDVTLTDCMIERQHALTDEIGDNIVGENLGGCELKVNKVLATKDLTHHEPSQQFQIGDKIVVLNLSAYYDGHSDGQGGVIGWQTAPCGITDGVLNMSLTEGWIYEDSDGELTNIQQVIDSMTIGEHSESIIGGYILPAELFTPFNASRKLGDSYDPSDPDDPVIIDGNGAQEPQTYNLSSANAYTDLDGYTPNNKKMFTAPYNWIYLLSTDGQMIIMQPQYLNNKNNVKLVNYHCITGVPEARLILQNYKGESECSEYYLNYSDFPQFAYSVDGYKAWLASGGEKKLDLQVSQVTRAQELVQSQTKFNAMLGTIKNVGQTAKGGLQIYNSLTSPTASRGQLNRGVSNVTEGVMNEVSNLGNSYYTIEASQQTIQFANENADLQRSIAKNLPSVTHGLASNTSLLGANNIKINLEQRCVNANIAKTIDDYFTMYGYAQNVVQKPNLKARSRFTYVKTIGCRVNGGAPSDSLAKLNSIFNSGIRFWNDHVNVCNYDVVTYPNTPLGV